MSRIDCVVGARPNFIKIAPILRALGARDGFRTRLIHTGQHNDLAMSGAFFAELDIPAPDIVLETEAGSVTQQTARIMMALEPIWEENRPDLVLLVGDVTSTLAAALTACKLGVAIAHVEAGLRSFDRSMPEETNRLIVDRLAALHYVTEPEGVENLRREGVGGADVALVGNVMIDSLFHMRTRSAPPSRALAQAGASAAFMEAAETGYGVVTVHRPSNVDFLASLQAILAMLTDLSRTIPLIFPVHPRTRRAMEAAGLAVDNARLFLVPPLGYGAMVSLMSGARFVITDSGGVQEETTALGVPCVTMRDSTERPITISEGTNVLAGADPMKVRRAVDEILAGRGKPKACPALWDGAAAERIAAHLVAYFARPVSRTKPE
jgi:UDP-N-acetylglucosamine 2-epimerase (non-hydrolysing)